MTVPTITAVRLTGAANRAELPLLVLGPSLGTSAVDAVDRLRGRAHRRLRRRRLGPARATATTTRCPTSRSRWPSSPRACSACVDEILEQRDQFGGSFAYAGDSVGGCVGLQLLLDHPDGSPRRCCSAPARRSASRPCGPAGSARSASPGPR